MPGRGVIQALTGWLVTFFFFGREREREREGITRNAQKMTIKIKLNRIEMIKETKKKKLTKKAAKWLHYKRTILL